MTMDKLFIRETKYINVLSTMHNRIAANVIYIHINAMILHIFVHIFARNTLKTDTTYMFSIKHFNNVQFFSNLFFHFF